MGFWRSRYKQYAKCDSYRRVRHITRYVCALRAGVGASSLSVVVTMKNGIEMSSKQISRQNCNIGQYLVQYISIFMLLWSILCFFFILHFFSLFVRLFFSCSFSIVRSFVCLFGNGTGCQAFCITVWVSLYVYVQMGNMKACFCVHYELSKQNEYERRKLIIKSQIYNDSNCNNNKHSRWAQCNSFPLLLSLSLFLDFFILYFCEGKIKRSLAFNFHQFLASFCFSSFLSFYPTTTITYSIQLVFFFVFFFTISHDYKFSCGFAHFSNAKFKW